MSLLNLRTAIPKHRYQVGEYSATILGDIESEDNVEYKYILAMVQEGSTNPKLYVTLERNSDKGQAGSHRLHLIGHGIDEVLGTSSDWRDLDAFTSAALGVAMEALALTDKQPHRLM